MTKYEIVKYKGLNNCIRAYNGFAELIIPTELGIRILSYKLCGGSNMFKNFDSQIKTKDKNEWQSFGGHRLWVSPESFEKTYEIDGIPLESYKITEKGVELVQKTDVVSKIRKEVTVSLSSEGSDVEVIHKITNTDVCEKTVAAWGITVMKEGGFCTVKTYKNENDPFDISGVILWPYSKMNDKRVYWGDRIISLKNNPKIDSCFKFGLFSQNGKALYINGKYVLKKEFSCTNTKKYSDINSNFESYVCANMIEIESLSPLKTLKTGESITHTERWSLFQTEEAVKYNDEEKICKLLE